MPMTQTQLEVDLGVRLTREDWNKLATHHVVKARCTRCGSRYVFIKRVHANEYFVTPAI